MEIVYLLGDYFAVGVAAQFYKVEDKGNNQPLDATIKIKKLIMDIPV